MLTCVGQQQRPKVLGTPAGVFGNHDLERSADEAVVVDALKGVGLRVVPREHLDVLLDVVILSEGSHRSLRWPAVVGYVRYRLGLASGRAGPR
jgi:hypothetical protein